MITIRIGDRRSGKTHDTIKAMIGALPPGWQGAVIAPNAAEALRIVAEMTGGRVNKRQRRIRLDESRNAVEVFGPRSFFNLRRMPCAAVAILGADRLPESAAVYALQSTGDRGRVFIAAGPPQTAKGAWVTRLVDGIRAGTAKGEVVECKQNPIELPESVRGLIAAIDRETPNKRRRERSKGR